MLKKIITPISVILIIIFNYSLAQENPHKSMSIDQSVEGSFDNIFKENNEISILFIGDFMGHMDQIKAAFDPETKKYNYDKTFEKIKPILSDADITIGNLEVTLGVKPYSGYPQFSSPVEYASAIKASGVDVLVTANNHSCDKGKLGLERTIRLLDSLNIGHTGTFTDLSQKQKSPCFIIKKNNMKIALINYTYGTNEIPPTHPNIVNYLDKKTVSSDVDLIRKEINPDQIIAFVHWGYQYQNMPNKKQLEWFEFFNSVGVNIVIGAHPHVLQPMQWEHGTDYTKDRLVAYSLGNFVSHQRTFPRDGGAVLKISLIKENNNIRVKYANYHLTWVHEFISGGKKYYDILSVKDYESKPEYFSNPSHYNKLVRFAKHARELLSEHNLNILEY